MNACSSRANLSHLQVLSRIDSDWTTLKSMRTGLKEQGYQIDLPTFFENYVTPAIIEVKKSNQQLTNRVLQKLRVMTKEETALNEKIMQVLRTHWKFSKKPRKQAPYTTDIKQVIPFSGRSYRAQDAFDGLALVIEDGKKNENQTLSKQIPLLSDAFGVNLALIKTSDRNGLTLLMIAAYHNNIAAVKILLDFGANPNETDDDSKNTSLLYACCFGSEELIKLLCKRGADPKHFNKKGFSPLFVALSKKNHTIIETLIKCGADPYKKNPYENLDTILFNAVKLLNFSTLKQLYSEPLLKKLCTAVEKKNLNQIGFLLDKNCVSTPTDCDKLAALFAVAANHSHFKESELLYTHPKGLSQFNWYRSPEQDLAIDKKNGMSKRFLVNKIYKYYFNYYSKTIVSTTSRWANKEQEILNAYARISELLCDVTTCTKYLKIIDYLIKQQCPSANKITPGKPMVVKGLRWPSPTFPKHFQALEKTGILRKILQKILSKHGIDAGPVKYTFAGFVSAKDANAIIKKGFLFKEQPLLGVAMLHGLYSHYFQWAIIALAYENKEIEFAGLNLIEIYRSTVEIKTEKNLPMWTHLLDRVYHSEQAGTPQKEPARVKEIWDPKDQGTLRYRLSSPHEINSFLLFSDELPFLRGYLLNQWYKNILKILKYQKSNYISIVAGQAYTYDKFTGYGPKLTLNHVLDYYQEKDSKAKVDMKTGIVTKPT